jgi:hypothetical protein
MCFIYFLVGKNGARFLSKDKNKFPARPPIVSLSDAKS